MWSCEKDRELLERQRIVGDNGEGQEKMKNCVRNKEVWEKMESCDNDRKL